MGKFRDRYNELTEEVLADELLSWLYLLGSGYESEEEVAAMSERFDAMVSFAREYGYALDDPKLERDFDRWLDSEMEWNSVMYEMKKTGWEEGLKEGRDEGLKQGREQASSEIAARLRELGVDEGVIAKATA